MCDALRATVKNQGSSLISATDTPPRPTQGRRLSQPLVPRRAARAVARPVARHAASRHRAPTRHPGIVATLAAHTAGLRLSARTQRLLSETAGARLGGRAGGEGEAVFTSWAEHGAGLVRNWRPASSRPAVARASYAASPAARPLPQRSIAEGRTARLHCIR